MPVTQPTGNVVRPNDGRSIFGQLPFARSDSTTMRRDGGGGGASYAVAVPHHASGSHWMDSINPHQPIPKLVPVRVVESVALPTICSSARAVLGLEKYATVHNTANAHRRMVVPVVGAGAPHSARNVVPPHLDGGAASPLLPLAAESSYSMRHDGPTFSNDADASSRSLKFDCEASYSSSTRSPRGGMAMSMSMARMQSGLFAGGRRHADGLSPDPHSELRRDLSSLFLQDPRAATFFKYLVWFGGPKAKPEYAPENLFHDEHQLLGLLFGVLDRDADGYIRTDDIKNAASVFHGKFGEYTRAYFRKMDRNCEGRVDFDQFLLAFFPQHTLQSLKQLRRSLAKPLTRLVCSTRELMAASDLAEVERNFQFFVHLSQRLELELADSRHGDATEVATSEPQVPGCSLPAYLSVVHDPEAKAFAEQMFYVFDTDHDGVLTIDDFLEMVKHMYPPFRKGSHGVPLDKLEGLAGQPSNSGAMPHVPSFTSAAGARRGGGPAPPMASSSSGHNVPASGSMGGRGQQTQFFTWRDFNDEERALFRLYKTIASNDRVLKFPCLVGNGMPNAAPSHHHRKGAEALASIVEMRQNELMARALLR